MVILEYVLLVILLLAAVIIIAAVLMQKSNEEGLSGAISGGADTFYGREKSAHTDRLLFKWTLIASIVFVIAVMVVYILQPDFSSSYGLDDWKNELTNYSHVFPTE